MDNIQNNNFENNNLDNDNLKDKSNNKFSIIHEAVLKDKGGREAYKESVRINNLINEAESKKSTLLMEMGILTYQQIREGYIKVEDFDSISNSILELDKFIYDRNIELKELKKKNTTNSCECGNTIKNNDKFCSICGKKVEELDDIIMISCEFCESEIEADSNYCVCCGKKVLFK